MPNNLEPEDTNVDSGIVDTTTKQANIKMITTDIAVFINDHGKTTPILIVAIAKVDGIEYAALFNVQDKKAYAVEVIRQKGQIKYFKDLDGEGQDEEWAVISNYFLKKKVFDINKINLWIWNTKKDYETTGKKAPGVVMGRK